MSKEILKIEDLSIEYNTEIATIYAVNGLSMDLGVGETLGLVGETGAGKTTTAKAIMRILPDKVGEVTDGKIYIEGKDIYSITEDEMCNIRGKIVSMVFQDPMSALNPIMTVGDQIKEVLQIHEKHLSKEELDKKVEQLGEGGKAVDIGPHLLQGAQGGEKAGLPQQEHPPAQQHHGQQQGRQPFPLFHISMSPHASDCL